MPKITITRNNLYAIEPKHIILKNIQEALATRGDERHLLVSKALHRLSVARKHFEKDEKDVSAELDMIRSFYDYQQILENSQNEISLDNALQDRLEDLTTAMKVSNVNNAYLQLYKSPGDTERAILKALNTIENEQRPLVRKALQKLHGDRKIFVESYNLYRKHLRACREMGRTPTTRNLIPEADMLTSFRVYQAALKDPLNLLTVKEKNTTVTGVTTCSHQVRCNALQSCFNQLTSTMKVSNLNHAYAYLQLSSGDTEKAILKALKTLENEQRPLVRKALQKLLDDRKIFVESYNLYHKHLTVCKEMGRTPTTRNTIPEADMLTSFRVYQAALKDPLTLTIQSHDTTVNAVLAFSQHFSNLGFDEYTSDNLAKSIAAFAANDDQTHLESKASVTADLALSSYKNVMKARHI